MNGRTFGEALKIGRAIIEARNLGVSITRNVKKSCNECGLCLLTKGEKVTRYRTQLSRKGVAPIVFSICGPDGDSMRRLVKELNFHMALPAMPGKIKTDTYEKGWLGATNANANAKLGRDLRKFFSVPERAQIGTASATATQEAVAGLSWLYTKTTQPIGVTGG